MTPEIIIFALFFVIVFGIIIGAKVWVRKKEREAQERGFTTGTSEPTRPA